MQTSVFHCSLFAESPGGIFGYKTLIVLHDPRATCVGWNDSYAVLPVLFSCTLAAAKGAVTAPSISKVFYTRP